MASRNALQLVPLVSLSREERHADRSKGHRLAHHLYSTALAAIVGTSLACSPAFAQSVAASGDVSPSVPAPPLTTWNPGNLRIGANGEGELTITAGGVVAGTGQALIGANAGSEGTVTVSGVGSRFSTATQAHVGSNGKGVLTITGGAAANIGTFLYIGRFAGAEGFVKVSGAGSSLTNGNMIQVGSEGKGTLIVEDGARVNSTNVVRIGLTSTSEGSAVVQGAGSNWTTNNSMSVGFGGIGRLNIAGGGSVSNVDGFIGREAGATGGVTVSGAGSTWTNTGELYVGSNGSGTLIVADGGMVTNTSYGYVGYANGSSGSATVTGAGSTWSSAATLRIGHTGTGVLTIADGGKVESLVGTAGANATGSGTVIVTGAGSTWTSTTNMSVGFEGHGALTIENGGAVNDVTGFIGRYAGATGTATVTGAGSTWTNNGSLSIGEAGTGTLTISAGGHVQNAAGLVGGQANAIGAVTVKDAGSTWTTTGTLYIGDLGKGALTVSDGGKATIAGGFNIGRLSGSEGLVTVSGAGSSLTNGNTTQVGSAGKGTLIVEDGGVGQANNLWIGVSSGSDGSVTVRGADSIWAAGGTTMVGMGGNGALTVENGGKVLNTTAEIGVGSTSQGTALVSGTGSNWSNSGNLTIGKSGSAMLTISDGARVGAGDGSGIIHVAEAATANGVVNIGAAPGDTPAGAGTLDAAEVRFGAGRGQLRFNHNDMGYLFAPIITGTGSVGHYSGTTILTGDNSYTGTTTIAGGVLQLGNGGTTGSIATDVAIGAAGTLRVDRSDDWTYAGGLSGTGAFDQFGTGTTRLTGDSSGFSGTTTVTNGRLIVGMGGAGSLGGAVDVLDGATLGGTGTVGSVGTAVTIADGGTLSAGNSIGTLTIAGDLMLNAGSILDFELGAPGSALGGGTSDHVAVAGNLTLDGVVNLSDAGGAGLGYYRLMTYGSLTDNGLAIGTTPALGTGNYEILTGSGFVDLRVGAAGDDELQIWQGGNGIWNAANLNWLNQGAEFPTTWASNHGAFTGVGGLVDVEGTQSFKGLQFVTNGYELAGSGTLQTVAGGSELRVLAGVSAAIGTGISGPGGIVKTQGGTLILTGANSYTGGTMIEDGVLSVASDTALGHTDGGLTLNGGILQVTGDSYQGTGRAISIGANGGGFDIGSPGNAFTLDQNITGTGNLYKLGAGTLILTGDSPYSGDATIVGGVLQLGGGGTTGSVSGDIQIGVAGTLRVNRSNDWTYAGALSGSGLLDQIGAGTTRLTGDSSGFTGSTTVANGSLIVGQGGIGALGGTVNILSGATLGGSGTAGSAGTAVTIAAGGVHAPGNGLGQQTILGDYMLRGTLQIDGTPAGTDRVNVHGAVDIAGSTLDLRLSPTAAQSWNVINGPFTLIDNRGSGAVNGRFAAVTNNLLFLDPHLNYAGGDGNDVTLDLIRNDVAFASVALTPNQSATAGAIDTMPFGNPIWNLIALTSDENAARRKFDLLSGEIHATALGALLEESRFPRMAVNDQLRAEPDDTSLWGHAYGSWADRHGDGNAASLERNTGGALLGLDRRLGGWRFGFVTGWNRTQMSVVDRASSAKAAAWRVGTYGGTEWGKLNLRLGLLYGEHKIETRRTIAIPDISETFRATYEASTTQMFGELAYQVESVDVRFEPFVNLAHVRTQAEGFAETGSDASLTGRPGAMSATLTTAGQRIEGTHALKGLAMRTKAMIGWQHLFGNVAPTSTHSFSAGDAFTIAGTPLARDSLLAEAGVELSLSKKATIGASYTGRFAGNGQDHAITATLRIGF